MPTEKNASSQGQNALREPMKITFSSAVEWVECSLENVEWEITSQAGGHVILLQHSP